MAAVSPSCSSCGSTDVRGGILVCRNDCQALLAARAALADREARMAALGRQLATSVGAEDCTIDAGAIGLVVYGPSRDRVAKVAQRLATFARESRRFGAVSVERAERAPDEPPATGWVVTVRIAWQEAA